MSRAHVRIYTSDACSFCERAKRLLAQKGVMFEEIRFARHDYAARQNLVDLTGRYTVPQVLIDDRPVGGYDDIKALDDAGDLDGLLGIAA
jgi:glutaredoxin 3